MIEGKHPSLVHKDLKVCVFSTRFCCSPMISLKDTGREPTFKCISLFGKSNDYILSFICNTVVHFRFSSNEASQWTLRRSQEPGDFPATLSKENKQSWSQAKLSLAAFTDWWWNLYFTSPTWQKSNYEKNSWWIRSELHAQSSHAYL